MMISLLDRELAAMIFASFTLVVLIGLAGSIYERMRRKHKGLRHD